MAEVLLHYAGAFVFGYLCGSIPFGVLLTRLTGSPDLRSIGSGNIGATDIALRSGRKGLAAATLVGDMLKGTLAILVTEHFLGRDFAIVAAAGAFLGHLFPVWLGFRGGKGVATYIGILLGLAWPAAIVFCVVWLAVAAATRYSSFAALVASVVAPGFLLVARRCARGRRVVGTVDPALDHAPRQHRATMARHRRQDRRRQQSSGRLLITPPPNSSASKKFRAAIFLNDGAGLSSALILN